MSTTEKYLTYQGNLRGIATVGKSLAFVTTHREKCGTAFYWLDVEKLELAEVALETGGVCLAAEGTTCWFGGDNGRLYKIAAKAKSAQQLEFLRDQPATGLALLSGDRLAVLCGSQIVVVDRDQGKTLQSLDLPEKGTALAADPSGEWLIAGTIKGTVAVFECEDRPPFQPAESQKLHEGAVTALLFEPEELRFLSAGADQKLLLTHARGKLEPEDRGRDGNHKDQVTAIVHAPGERFITGSRDKSCKTWTRAGATRPATLSDGVPIVVDLALVEIHGRPHLVVAGEDNSLRLFVIDAGGKFGAATHRVYDAYDRAAHLLSQSETAQRGEALHALAQYDDLRSVEMIAARIGVEPDHALRLRGTELLSKSKHPRAARLLEPLLANDDGAVRMAAFAGMRVFAGKENLRPLELALKSKKADVGVAAVAGLEPLAKKDEQSRQLLVKSLDNECDEVRRAALLSLENVFAKGSPESTLIALTSKQPETRRLALVRSYQRGLLADSRVAAGVRRRIEDESPEVRRTAFLVSLLSRDNLLKAVRERDKELHRQLFELETFEIEPKKGAQAKDPPKVIAGKFKLDPADYEPLLSAMSCRVVDTCLLGARCLALLGDPRAFGLLLQLSREDDASVRVQVCQALAALDDERAIQRLETLIDDAAPEVRDAAYTALAKIREATPLEAATAGLGSQHADVRRRGLQSLVATLRKTKTKETSEPARALLLRALNDSDAPVRGEAFKSVLNLNVAGDSVATLRFVLNSVHASVRREVLTEAMAQDNESWAWQLLLDLLNDPDSQVRADAFEHVLKKTKGRDVAPLQIALKCRFVDIRKRATEGLINLKSDAAQAALVSAIDDEDVEVRGQALQAMIAAEAESVLRQAMHSRYIDVRLQAASARAYYSDPSAREPLLAAATEPQPEREAYQQLWQRTVLLALRGLSTLGDPECVPQILPLLDYQDATAPAAEKTAGGKTSKPASTSAPSSKAEIRKSAAEALIWSIRPQQAELLKVPLQHSDNEVKFRVAMALALCGEGVAGPLIFSDAAAKVLSEKELLIAAAAYGTQGETRLTARLDSNTPWIRKAAFLILLLRDWRAHNGTPARLLAALAAQAPRIRLAAARAMETFSDPDAFAAWILDFLNDRGDEKPWTITAETLSDLANLIVFGSSACLARSIALFESLGEEKEDGWSFGWRMHTLRFQNELESARKTAAQSKPPKIKTPPEELAQLAFGTFVGLVREQGSYHEKGTKPSFEAPVLSIRQSAIRRLVDLAKGDAIVLQATRPVLIQALGDKLQEVRTLAFERLAELGLEPAERAALALECGHNDLAVAGLKLLTESAGAKGQAILAEIVTTREDSLAMDAARLLLESAGIVKAADSMLESPHQDTRQWGVNYLANAYEEVAAKKKLRSALESRYPDVRRRAALNLAVKKDEAAFDALSKLLFEPEVKPSEVITAFVRLGDPRSVDILLDRVQSDPEKTADVAFTFQACGQFRDPKNAPRLLELLDRKEWREHAAQALMRISGHDQAIADFHDDLPDRKWMEKQFPRHDQVLASLFERCIEVGWTAPIQANLGAARWSLSSAVDSVLTTLSAHPEEKLRQAVIESIGWRLKNRKGPPQPLLSALEHRDPLTKFLAAEGLAKAGRAEGISVLLSAVELMSDLVCRRRAVLALGELADERSLELLLKLASDDVHALQESAAEAIGHLGKSNRADKILELLLRLAKSSGSVSRNAIVGLRWLNTPRGWALLRELAREQANFHLIVEQLGYNDDPATRALMLEVLTRSVLVGSSVQAARRLFGNDSLEPDYAVLKSEVLHYQHAIGDDLQNCLKRVCERGEPGRIFEILPMSGERFDALAFNLTNRKPLPETAAAAALTSPHAATVEVAAGVLGRSGNKTHGKAIATAITRWLAEWESRYQKARKQNNENEEEDLGENALVRLCWAAGRVAGAKAELLALPESHLDIARFTPVRIAALAALGQFKLTKEELATMEKAAEDPDAGVREQAATVLAAQDPKLAGKFAEKHLSDRVVFQRITASGDVKAKETLAAGAIHIHYQPIVMPGLLAAGDLKTLVDTATNAVLNDTTRLGAIEGLARLANPTASDTLLSIAKNEANDEELRKAAYRALRRLKRSIEPSTSKNDQTKKSRVMK